MTLFLTIYFTYGMLSAYILYTTYVRKRTDRIAWYKEILVIILWILFAGILQLYGVFLSIFLTLFKREKHV